MRGDAPVVGSEFGGRRGHIHTTFCSPAQLAVETVEAVDYSRCLAPPESVNRTTRCDIHIGVPSAMRRAMRWAFNRFVYKADDPEDARPGERAEVKDSSRRA